MKVLAIDTAGPVAGVALLVGDQVFQRTERVLRGADTRLMPWALELAKEAGIRLSELDGVAVGAGPGAFTGLRVGLATGLGLATAVGCQVFAGSTLDSRAASVPGIALCALDARKGRLYAAWYSDGQLLRGPDDAAPDEVLAGAAAAFVATGEGAIVYREAIQAAGGVVWVDAADPGVGSLARQGAAAFAAGRGQSPLEVRPTYLRGPDAKPTAAR